MLRNDAKKRWQQTMSKNMQRNKMMPLRNIIISLFTIAVYINPPCSLAAETQHIDGNIQTGNSVKLKGLSDDLSAILLSNIISNPDNSFYEEFYLYHDSWELAKTIDEVLIEVAPNAVRNNDILKISPSGEHLLFATRDATSIFKLYSYRILTNTLAEISSTAIGLKSINYVLGFTPDRRVMFANYEPGDNAASIYSNSLDGDDIQLHTSLSIRLSSGADSHPSFYNGVEALVSKDGSVLFLIEDNSVKKVNLTVHPSTVSTIIPQASHWGQPTISDDGNIFTFVTDQTLMGEAVSLRRGYSYISNEDRFYSATQADSYTWPLIIAKDGTKILHSSTSDYVGSNTDKNLELFVSGPRGENVAQITNTRNPKTTYTYHAVSNDGNTIAYVQADNNDTYSRRNYSINVFSPPTNSTLHIYTLQDSANSPVIALSGDGSKLLYNDHDENGNRRLLRVNLLGLTNPSETNNTTDNNPGSGGIGVLFILLLFPFWIKRA